MQDPKTTTAGILGLIGAVLAGVGSMFPGKTWGQVLVSIGLLISGANGVGNMYAKDAK